MNSRDPVAMVHHQCDTCGVTATMVVTEASERAWEAHGDIHGPLWQYSTWTWEVLPLFNEHEIDG